MFRWFALFSDLSLNSVFQRSHIIDQVFVFSNSSMPCARGDVTPNYNGMGAQKNGINLSWKGDLCVGSKVGVLLFNPTEISYV